MLCLPKMMALISLRINFFDEPREAASTSGSGSEEKVDSGEPPKIADISDSIEEIARMAKEIAMNRKTRFLDMLSGWMK